MQQFINSVNFFVRSAPAALTFSIISCDLEIEQLIICAATRPPGWTATARRRDTLPRPPTIPLFAPLSRRIFCSHRCSRRRRRPRPPPRSFPPRSPLPRSHLCLERGMDFLGIVHFANFEIKKKSQLLPDLPKFQAGIGKRNPPSVRTKKGLARAGQLRHAGAPPVASSFLLPFAAVPSAPLARAVPLLLRGLRRRRKRDRGRASSERSAVRRRERERETGADTEPCAIKIQARNHSLPIVSFVLQTSLKSVTELAKK